MVGGSDDGRQEIALDEEEYDGEENGADLGPSTSGVDDRAQNVFGQKDETPDANFPASNAETNSPALSKFVRLCLEDFLLHQI